MANIRDFLPQKDYDQFLHLTEAEDADGIYTIFSQTAKEETENLKEKNSEWIQFLNENMTSWKHTSGMGNDPSLDGIIINEQSSHFLLYMNDITYKAAHIAGEDGGKLGYSCKIGISYKKVNHTKFFIFAIFFEQSLVIF